jgi:hypothetical protein
MFRFSASFPRLALGATAALAAISLSPGSAQAFVVNVGGVQYDVTTFTGTYNDNTSKFQTAANSGVMPWWGSSSLASDFAMAVGSAFGSPNVGPGRGPYFAYAEVSMGPVSIFFRKNDGSFSSSLTAKQVEVSWAQATPLAPPAAPVPGPLPALGAATAFSFSRQLRKRIKRSTNAISSSSSL